MKSMYYLDFHELIVGIYLLACDFIFVIVLLDERCDYICVV